MKRIKRVGLNNFCWYPVINFILSILSFCPSRNQQNLELFYKRGYYYCPRNTKTIYIVLWNPVKLTSKRLVVDQSIFSMILISWHSLLLLYQLYLVFTLMIVVDYLNCWILFRFSCFWINVPGSLVKNKNLHLIIGKQLIVEI